MRKIFILICFFNSLFLTAQGEANNWFFGERAGLNFNSGEPTTVNGGRMSTTEGCATFSDSNGDLLFYTDGSYVWNKNHTKMPSTINTPLKGNSSSTQSAIIVPYPKNNKLFYIFTVGAIFSGEGEFGFHAYKVDMTKDTGLGDIDGSEIPLMGKELNSDWSEKVTSVKGAECNTFWVISLVKNKYYSYKIDENGLNPSPVISTVNYVPEDKRGYLKASPDGKFIASATFTQYYDRDNNENIIGPAKLHLYSFNDATGEVSNNGINLITNPERDGAPYGVEFSSNSSKLYTATFNGEKNKLFQFDLNSSNITTSKYLVNSQTGYRGALQLAPNGKIYATVPISYSIGTNFLNAVNLPNEKGIRCDFKPEAVDLGVKSSMQGLPPFIASLLLPVEITDGNSNQNINNTIAKRCIGEDYQLIAQNIEGNPTYKWTFNGSVVSTTNTLSLPNLNVANEGAYNFEAETVDLCGSKIFYSGIMTIEVYEPPTITKPTDITQCDDDNDGFFNFDLHTLKDTEVLNTQDPTVFEVAYFTNLTDATNNENAITMPYINSAPFSTDTVIARIQNIQNPICFEIESFTIQVSETPNPPASISNLSICDSDLVGTDTDGLEIFDLTLKEIEILNGQSPANFTITYFKTSDLSPITNPTSYQNSIAHLETITVSIVNNNNTNCTATTSFNVEVYKLPTITNTFTFKQCDEDGLADGFTDFNLNEANDYLTNDTSLNITYYLSQTEAENNDSPINVSPFSNKTQATVFARIENSNGCFRVATVNLLVSSTSFPANFLKTVTHCDDDNTLDGLNLFNLSENDTDIINALPSGQNLTVTYYRTLEDAQLETKEIPKDQPYLSEVPLSQTLFVRVESNDNGACFGLGPHLQLDVNPRPEFELIETDIYCRNLPPKTVSIQNPNGNYNYSWVKNGVEISDDPYASITEEGVYTVIATSIYGCESFPQTLTVEPSIIATISENDITITDDSENNTITISTSNLGIGDYEYSLIDMDGGIEYNYQNDPFFNNVSPGIHTIYIRDKNSCGIAEIDVSVLGFPKFFSPNNDGQNDYWSILGVNSSFYTSSNIYIFDRYGKLLTKINPKENGWNGTLNGVMLPSTDYWFSAELIDSKGNIRVRKGHFSLLR